MSTNFLYIGKIIFKDLKETIFHNWDSTSDLGEDQT
jgi:hypothetical protein